MGWNKVGAPGWRRCVFVPCQLGPVIDPASIGIWVRFLPLSLITAYLLGGMQVVDVGEYLVTGVAHVGSRLE